LSHSNKPSLLTTPLSEILSIKREDRGSRINAPVSSNLFNPPYIEKTFMRGGVDTNQTIIRFYIRAFKSGQPKKFVIAEKFETRQEDNHVPGNPFNNQINSQLESFHH